MPFCKVGGLLRAVCPCGGQQLQVAIGCYEHLLLLLLCFNSTLPASPRSLLLRNAGIGFMAALTHRRRVASAHQQGLEVACSTHVPAAHIR